MIRQSVTILFVSAALVACTNGGDATAQPTAGSASVETLAFAIEDIGQFDQPWAMAFWGNDLLVTEQGGKMWRVEAGGRRHEVTGIPAVDYGGQGGLGDVVVGPDGAWIYFSYAEAGEGDTRGAVVARGHLVMAGNGRTAMTDIETIWRQAPKVSGRGHYSHRIAFGPDGYLWIASGERQKGDPAQDLTNNLGSIVRLNADGSVPADNPFATRGGVAAQIWSYGHRNILGLGFDGEGRLWEVEHGPAGGDELNLVARGDNYGWPTVSNGDDYDRTPIPRHDTRPEFHPPIVSWTPVIAPGGMTFYTGPMFADWQGDMLIAGLKSKAIIRVTFDGTHAREAARYPMENRLREIEQGPDGAIWLLEDQRDGAGGRLLRLTPAAR